MEVLALVGRIITFLVLMMFLVGLMFGMVVLVDKYDEQSIQVEKLNRR